MNAPSCCGRGLGGHLFRRRPGGELRRAGGVMMDGRAATITATYPGARSPPFPPRPAIVRSWAGSRHWITRSASPRATRSGGAARGGVGFGGYPPAVRDPHQLARVPSAASERCLNRLAPRVAQSLTFPSRRAEGLCADGLHREPVCESPAALRYEVFAQTG